MMWKQVIKILGASSVSSIKNLGVCTANSPFSWNHLTIKLMFVGTVKGFFTPYSRPVARLDWGGGGSTEPQKVDLLDLTPS